jgi:hypothetical protein
MLNEENTALMLRTLWKNKPLYDAGEECVNLVISQFDEFHKEFIE